MTTVEKRSLSKEVPTHLFQFRETVFGPVTVQQLLYDIAAFAGIWYLGSQPLPLVPRILLCGFCALLALVIIHVTFDGNSTLDLLFLYLRAWTMPAQTVWMRGPAAVRLASSRIKGLPASVQQTWIPLRAVGRGCLGFAESSKATEVSRYCLVMEEVEGPNLGLLSDEDYVRVHEEYERFLAGLQLPLQYIITTAPIAVHQYEPLSAQKQQIAALPPRLAALRQDNLAFHQGKISACLRTRHFVVVPASRDEEALRTPEGKPRPGWQVLAGRGWVWGKQNSIPAEALLARLHDRAAVVQSGLARLGISLCPLEDAALLHFYATCLAPGAPVTGFSAGEVAQARLHVGTTSTRERKEVR